jgi:hypothetical protein
MLGLEIADASTQLRISELHLQPIAASLQHAYGRILIERSQRRASGVRQQKNRRRIGQNNLFCEDRLGRCEHEENDDTDSHVLPLEMWPPLKNATPRGRARFHRCSERLRLTSEPCEQRLRRFKIEDDTDIPFAFGPADKPSSTRAGSARCGKCVRDGLVADRVVG